MLIENPFPRPTSDTVCSVEGFLYFVRERENIRLRRSAGEAAPWTEDPILRKYKFTNIHRSHDRVSQWIINRVLKPNESREDLWFILLITRLLNWPATLQHLIDTGILFAPAREFDPVAFSNAVENLEGKRYSGAYMVYPTKREPGGFKSLALAKYIIQPALLRYDEITHSIFDTSREASIERFVNTLSQCFGVSTFMAGQVAADMTYENGSLCDANDIQIYAPMGPGSQRGLNYLLRRPAFAGWNQQAFNRTLIDLYNTIYRELHIPTLTLHDVQNIACEYSKYAKTALGEGVPKTTYKPETEF
jgi:hypothetical protein